MSITLGIYGLCTYLIPGGLYSRIAYKRSFKFYRWYFNTIFEASIEYGGSLKEVMTYRQAAPEKPAAKSKAGRK